MEAAASLDDGPFQVEARFPCVRALAAALAAVRSPGRQTACLSFDAAGLTVKWEHESKALQAAVFLGTPLFERYRVGAAGAAFGVPLGRLLDTLAALAGGAGPAAGAGPGGAGAGAGFGGAAGGGGGGGPSPAVELRYPGADGELLLDAAEPPPPDGGAPLGAAYARLPTQAPPAVADLMEHWDGGGAGAGGGANGAAGGGASTAAYFIAPAAAVREAVEDLEWARAAEAGLRLCASPPGVRLAAGADRLAVEVALPPAMLSALAVPPLGAGAAGAGGGGSQGSPPERRAAFKYRLLRQAFAGVPQRDPAGGSSTTKVAVDGAGMLRVTHMLAVAGGPADGAGAGFGGFGGGGASLQTASAADSFAGDLHGGGGGAPQRVAVVQFLLLPHVDGAAGGGGAYDDDGGAGGGGAAAVFGGSGMGAAAW